MPGRCPSPFSIVDVLTVLLVSFKILVEKFKEDYLQNKALSESGELERVMLGALYSTS